MALLSDGTVATLEDLKDYENGIFDVASTEQIDLSKKLQLAQRELEVILTDFLLRRASADFIAVGSRQRELAQVVVTPAMRQWHTFHTLALAYRDAYSTQRNDRYMSKWKEYEGLANWASRKSFETGIGMVSNPVGKAAAAQLTAISGTAPAGTYWVKVAWTGQAGAEGAPGDPAYLSITSGSTLSVKAQDPPANATGWNVYAGATLDSLKKQNAQPLAIGASWVMPPAGPADGTQPGDGQQPEYFVTLQRVLPRG